MNRSELIAAVENDARLTKKQATAAVGAVLENIEIAMRVGDDVALVGFGTFKAISRPGRTGRNPRTGEEIQIPATRAPKFVPGKNLKAALN